MNHRSRTSRGFTIIELLVGLMVASLVLGGASFALARMIKARNSSVSRQVAFARAEAAAGRVALDLIAAARSPDLTFAKVAISDAGSPASPRDELLLLFTSRRPLRGLDGVPEGHLFESQYRVAATPEGTSALWRRVDTGFDIAVDGGGVAAPEFRGIVSFGVDAYDGTAWFTAWDSDNDGIPHAVRVTITATDDEGKVEAIARRIVSLDRVPVPPETEDEETDTDSSGTSGTTGGTG
jgi:prepilin-type N-terminal cleavage/methylation domain-containing protein